MNAARRATFRPTVTLANGRAEPGRSKLPPHSPRCPYAAEHDYRGLGFVTVTLPDYNGARRLPYAAEPYSTTLDEIRSRFVENAATAKAQRERLFRALEMHVELVRRRFGTGIRAWIDGGFVTDKDWPPKDIDVAYVMPVDRYVDASRPEHASLWTLQTVSALSPSLFIDRLQPMGGMIDAFPAIDDPSQTDYWHEKWSGVTDRNGETIEGERKGFVEVRL